MYELLNSIEILAPIEAIDKGFEGDFCVCEYPYISNHSQKIKLSDKTWTGILYNEMGL